jgi:hypothetical protein
MTARRPARAGARKSGNGTNRDSRSNKRANLKQDHAFPSLLGGRDRRSGWLESCIAGRTFHLRRGSAYWLLGLALRWRLGNGLCRRGRLRLVRSLGLRGSLGLHSIGAIRELIMAG